MWQPAVRHALMSLVLCQRGITPLPATKREGKRRGHDGPRGVMCWVHVTGTCRTLSLTCMPTTLCIALSTPKPADMLQIEHTPVCSAHTSRVPGTSPPACCSTFMHCMLPAVTSLAPRQCRLRPAISTQAFHVAPCVTRGPGAACVSCTALSTTLYCEVRSPLHCFIQQPCII